MVSAMASGAADLLPARVRATPQRRAIAEALAMTRGHFTVAELHEQARVVHSRLGLATTYRTLELLRKSGSVRLIATERGPCYIRCHAGHHHHLVCIDCGSVQDTDLCAAPPADEIRRRHGFEPAAHEVEIYGRCAGCAT